MTRRFYTKPYRQMRTRLSIVVPRTTMTMMYAANTTSLFNITCTMYAWFYYVTRLGMIRNTHLRATSTQPSWINNMMAHIKPNRVSEFSTSGTGDDVDVFWEPPSSYVRYALVSLTGAWPSFVFVILDECCQQTV
ncbi:hypothetical protein BDR07DRAFT_756360 [Suillus spraguei]|nr:hypothetical protein BDR07DRAFT_756360 [Suillus spraguei]